MVLAHVDSGNDIIDEEFGLPKWVRQFGDGNNVIVEVHMGCGQVGIKKEDGTGRQEQAILGFERTIQQLQPGLGFVYNGYDQSPGSQGGMILRNGYRVDFKVNNLETISDLASRSQPKEKERYEKAIQKIKELKANLPVNRTDRLAKILAIEQQTTTELIKPNTIQIINDNTINIPMELQLSFDEKRTKTIYQEIQQQIPDHIKTIIDNTLNNIATHIKDTLNLQNKTKIDSKFCHEHNIKVPLILLNEINRFENGLTEEFKNRINNQPYIKDIEHYKEEETYIDRQEYWRDYISKRQKMSKKTLERM